MDTVQRFCAAAAAACVAIALAPAARAAGTPDKPCPDDTDVAYTVVKDDTLWNIAAHSYCLNEWPPLFFGVQKLAEYNRAEIGWDYDHIHAGTVVCLPQRIARGRWHADRCAAGGGEASSAGNGAGQKAAPAAVAPANPCPTEPCAQCGQCGQCCCQPGSGQGSGNGQGADGAGNGANREPPRPKKPLVVRFAAEITGGVALPLTSEMREYIYRLVGVVGAGARVNIGAFEIAPRGFFLYGDHGTNFNDVEQQQTIIGGGLIVQAGVAFDFGGFRLTPGVEGGFIYTKRTIMLNDYPFAGQVETQTGYLPLAGAFLRPAYNFGSKRQWSVSLNLSADIILTRLGDNDVSTNISTMLLGGVGYAF